MERTLDMWLGDDDGDEEVRSRRVATVDATVVRQANFQIARSFGPLGKRSRSANSAINESETKRHRSNEDTRFLLQR